MNTVQNLLDNVIKLQHNLQKLVDVGLGDMEVYDHSQYQVTGIGITLCMNEASIAEYIENAGEDFDDSVEMPEQFVAINLDQF